MSSYFKLNNLGPLVDLNGRKAKFEHRNTSGFSEKISLLYKTLVLSLEKRNFDVPGFDIDFSFDVETGVVRVFTIENEEINFRVVGDYQFNIKGKEISIHEDHSGSLDVYALDNWEKDRKEFVHGTKFHRCMNKQSRLSLGYSFRNYSYGSEYREGKFVYDSDSREYQPEGNEPKEYSLKQIEKELADALVDVIKHVNTFKSVRQHFHPFVEPNPKFLTNDLFRGKVLYGFRDQYHNDERGLVPNTRLLNLGMSLPKKHQFKDQMHDGFVYMEIAEAFDEVPIKPTNTDGFNSYYWKYDKSGNKSPIVAIVPKRYNNFYVIDAGVYSKLKDEWFKANPKEDKLSTELFHEFRMKQAETMVEINNYRGGFEKPIVITNRRIWQDEIAIPVLT